MSTQKAARDAAASCLGKAPFDTWREAKQVLRHIVDRGDHNPLPGHKLAVYQCRHCHKMHIGSGEQKKRAVPLTPPPKPFGNLENEASLS
jgi:hypothetical protein